MKLWHCESIEELNSLSKEDLAWLSRDLIGHCKEFSFQRNWTELRVCQNELKLMRDRLCEVHGSFLQNER